MLMALMWLIAGMAGAGVGLVIVVERKIKLYDRMHPKTHGTRTQRMTLKVVNGLSYPIDTATTEKWVAETETPIPGSHTEKIRTVETLHRTSNGDWVLQIVTTHIPRRTGIVPLEVYQLSNEQHAVDWMGRNGVPLSQEFEHVAEAMKQRGRRARRTRRPSA